MAMKVSELFEAVLVSNRTKYARVGSARSCSSPWSTNGRAKIFDIIVGQQGEFRNIGDTLCDNGVAKTVRELEGASEVCAESKGCGHLGRKRVEKQREKKYGVWCESEWEVASAVTWTGYGLFEYAHVLSSVHTYRKGSMPLVLFDTHSLMTRNGGKESIGVPRVPHGKGVIDGLAGP